MNDETAPLPLDWTRIDSNPSRRYPQDVVPPDTFSPNDTTSIEIVGTAGQKITHIGEFFHTLVNAPQTTHFILRSHLIQSMRGVRHFTNLQLLELYDNQLEVLEELGPEEVTEPWNPIGYTTLDNHQWPGKTITTLDLSYNVIRSMEPVQFCVNLQVLCKD
jgi:Leucine-rich repeat (LRR) protein